MLNPIKLMLAMRFMKEDFRKEVKERTNEAIKALCRENMMKDNAGEGDHAGMAELLVSIAVCTNILATVILSIYDKGNHAGTAAFSMMAILDNLEDKFKEEGLAADIANMSDVNDIVEEMKKSAGFNK